MTGHKCCVSDSTRAQDSGVSFHCIHKKSERISLWLEVFFLSEDVIKPSTQVCSRHFPGGEVKIFPVFP